MPDTVLVTGVSGFLGGHVALALLDAGYSVRGSVRDLSRADKVRSALGRAVASGKTGDLEFVALDLTNDVGWQEAAAGCRFVHHVASPFVVNMPKDPDELIGPAVEGTRRALGAALGANVERVVLTSSAAAIMYGHPKSRTAPFTEADWSVMGGQGVTAYIESKTRAELEAWTIMEGAGRRDDLAVINPTAILGPLLDDDPGTSAALLIRLLSGSVPAVPHIEFGYIDVRDVAALHLAAMETLSAGGKRFLGAAGVRSLFQISEALRPALPDYARKLPRFELPDWVVRMLAPFDAGAKAAVPSLGLTKPADASAALALLGRPFISPGDAAIATARSLIAAGLV